MNESYNAKGFSVSLFVNNKPGVLVRIAQTFARRGYNIDSLVVSNAHDARYSRTVSYTHLTLPTNREV